ncbi:MBL fold metallo-hydrolase RNA specificity domain-containing protein [Aneurinibacillus terranovensis]|uniref:MBL fold metallo-hydrolase RNA specificity domain-containing protein n=1 Tax=Aneurinibacillus terranovensis TaxID=278991 RepID=UPI0003F6BB0B|nr:MBL fold metallo-hydrolase [Aneurinibacillus terranovensis]
MKVQFFWGARTVTGSCYLIDTGKHKVLVDCGMFQGNKELEERNREPFAFQPREIAAVILTHAHIDHSGLLPRLHKQGFTGPIICTKTTAELCEIMLPDSGHIQEFEAEWYNRKRRRKGHPAVSPIYTEEDARRCLHLFQGVSYGQLVDVVPGITVRMRDAGHILGSAIIEMWIQLEDETYKFVFSGDLGNKKQEIVRDPEYIEEADYVFIESTYGDRLHERSVDRRKKLCEIIQTVQQDGGNIIIPSFSVGRTQEIIYEIAELLHSGEIKPLPVFIDSPLATEATKIFRKNEQNFDEQSQRYLAMGMDPLSFPGLTFTASVEESQRLNRLTSGTIIISASGMCEAGRIKHHLKHNLWRSKSHIVFVGYQAQGTLGRLIVDGAKRVRIYNEEIKVAAHIHYIEGFSAHADRAGLLEWLGAFKKKPRKVFVVHGEEEVAVNFASMIQTDMGVDTYVPGRFELIDIGKDSIISQKEKQKAEPGPELHKMLSGLEQNIRALQDLLKDKPMTAAEKQMLEEQLDRYVEILEEIVEDCETGTVI